MGIPARKTAFPFIPNLGILTRQSILYYAKNAENSKNSRHTKW